MARQMGPVYILGTIGGITFYKSGNDYLARKKGGPTKKQILKSTAFERTRENFTEFGRCSKAGKFLRRCVGNLLRVSDPFAYQRMTQLMTRIKNHDRESLRGQRNVSIGLRQQEAKELLYNFAFNAERPLQKVVVKRPVINANKEIHIQSKDLVFPSDASHALISGARLHLNFEQESSLSVVYTEQMLSVTDKDAVIKLRAKQKEEREGNEFYFLQVRFYKMDAGKLVPFENGKQDSLGCIALDPSLTEEIKTYALKGEILSFEIKRVIIFQTPNSQKSLPVWTS